MAACASQGIKIWHPFFCSSLSHNNLVMVSENMERVEVRA
jgi:hypothetical protein